jgi:hypothetical protein
MIERSEMRHAVHARLGRVLRGMRSLEAFQQGNCAFTFSLWLFKTAGGKGRNKKISLVG